MTSIRATAFLLALLALLPAPSGAAPGPAQAPTGKCPTYLRIATDGAMDLVNCAGTSPLNLDEPGPGLTKALRRAPKGSERRIIIDAPDGAAYQDVLFALNILQDHAFETPQDKIGFVIGFTDGPGGAVMWSDLSPESIDGARRRVIVRIGERDPLSASYGFAETGLRPRRAEDALPPPLTVSLAFDGLAPWLAGLGPIDDALVAPTSGKVPWGRVRAVYKVLAAHAPTGFISELPEDQ